MALAFKMQKSDRVAACFFGDGAVAEGAFHEGVNMAAIWNLPVIFVCENNLYGASTHVSKVMRDTHIARRVGSSYGIRAEQVDGNDVLAVYEAAKSAVDAVSGRQRTGLPGIAHLSLDRPLPARPVPLSAQGGTRSVGRQGPHRSLRSDVLKRRGLIDDAGLEAVKTRIRRDFDAAVEVARGQPLPTSHDLTTDVFA